MPSDVFCLTNISEMLSKKQESSTEMICCHSCQWRSPFMIILWIKMCCFRSSAKLTSVFPSFVLLWHEMIWTWVSLQNLLWTPDEQIVWFKGGLVSLPVAFPSSTCFCLMLSFYVCLNVFFSLRNRKFLFAFFFFALSSFYNSVTCVRIVLNVTRFW